MEEREYDSRLDMKVWNKLAPLLSGYRGALALVVALNCLTAAVDVIMPLFQRYAIARFITPASTEGLGAFAAAYIAVIIFQASMVVAFGRKSMRIEMGVGRDLKDALFRRLQTLSLSFYNVTPVGYLISRVMSDTNNIATTVAWSLADMMWSVFYVLGVFAAMFALNVRLALLVSLTVPALALLTWYFQRGILRWNRRLRRLNSALTGAFNEGIAGAVTVKTLNMEEASAESFRKISESARASGIGAARLNALYLPLVMFCSSLAVAAVVLRGGRMNLSGGLSIETLAAFVTYAIGIFEPIQMIASNIAEFISMQACVERVSDLLAREPEVKDSPNVAARYGGLFDPKRENWEPLRGDIEFRDVTFRYPDGGANVLEHFNLKIPAGTNVAIVGETGAGKSTIVNLVCRFFEPTEGKILIDGRDARERSLLWLHSNIGYVLQNPQLFSGSVRENIRYGRLDATDEEVEAAARAVSADRVIAALERGWDSEAGEGGGMLSTGEKQLVSFARAILADPKIFVLDEATSSIDAKTESMIQNAVDTLLRGRTSFVIAHRLSTVRKADLILVVKNGKIVEKGTHSELLRAKGRYYELYTRQFAEESSAAILNFGTGGNKNVGL